MGLRKRMVHKKHRVDNSKCQVCDFSEAKLYCGCLEDRGDNNCLSCDNKIGYRYSYCVHCARSRGPSELRSLRSLRSYITIYRALTKVDKTNIDNKKSLVCKNFSDLRSPLEHVFDGSYRFSQFISTTRNLVVALRMANMVVPEFFIDKEDCYGFCGFVAAFKIDEKDCIDPCNFESYYLNYLCSLSPCDRKKAYKFSNSSKEVLVPY